MKKISFVTLCAAGLGLILSCSNEKLVMDGELSPVTVTASVEYGNTATKSLPSAPAGYQLRCIMVVDYPTVADVRYETVSNGTGNFTFSFIPEENGYTCLLWADYVAGGEASEGRYADKYYDTGNLKAITYVSAALADGSLFNNDACDAFYGSLAQGKTSVTLYRPFTRLTFKNTGNAPIAGLEKLGVSCPVYSGFNVADGTTSQTQTISMTDGTAADAAAGVWFYSYVFAPKDQNRLPGDITFKKNDDSPRTISSAGIPLDANADQGMSFTYGEQIDITVDIEGEYGKEPKPELHVGDYFYSDGTYGTAYENLGDKTVIGVVFAIAGGDAAGDVSANYAGSDFASAGEINGWVVALTNLSGQPRFYGTAASDKFASSQIPENLGTGEEDIMGYRNTNAWIALNTEEKKFNAAQNTVNFATAAPQGTSGWYIPSAKQMKVLLSVYAQFTDSYSLSTVGSALERLPYEGETNPYLLANESGNYNLWTSTAHPDLKDGYVQVYRGQAVKSAAGYGKVSATENIGSGSYVRPILTF